MAPELEGIVPPIVTPFDADGAIDESLLREEIGYHLAAGVHGVSVCGSTGEGNALTLEEHSRVYEIAVEEAGGEVPVVAGAIATSGQEAAEKARRARAAGADVVMATPPHYMTPLEEGLVDYFGAVGDAGGLPILIYDVIEDVDVTADVALRIAEAVPELYGIKQSGGDFHGLANMLDRAGDDLRILTALDDLLYPSFELGAEGAIAGVNAIYPRLSVELWEAVRRGDEDRAREIHEATLRLAREAVWEAQVNFPAGVKAAMEVLGRDPGHARNPIRPVPAARRRKIEAAVERMRERGVAEAER
jgi:4-hydroxy-tetrahydrodipicolinate synthase